jgi:CheY-like chemotaxis protein
MAPRSVDTLLIDDDVDMRGATALALMDHGYSVATAANGADALQLLQANVQPRVLLLDLDMPVMDGREFIARCEGDGELWRVPVIVVTGQDDASDLFERVEILLRKPIDLDDLVAAIDRTITK